MTHALPVVRLVDLQAQYAALKEELDTAIRDVMAKGQFVGGQEVEDFAEAFAAVCGARYCIPCANGTDALELALGAFGIGPGDEVIIPAMTFVATLEAVCNAGATPVLCDIDPTSMSMDPRLAERLVTGRTKAIIPVHLYGQMADMEALGAIAKRNGLRLIEDAAQAHGAAWRGQAVGSIGDAGCFSFYPGKNLGAYGDAGAITTSDPAAYDHMRRSANHGRLSKYNHDLVGRNSRMDTLQAAILLVKLRHLQAWTARRQALAKAYSAMLSDIREIRCPTEQQEAPSVYHLYVIHVPADRREALRTWLNDRQIETGIHYPAALSQLTVTREVLGLEVSCPEAERGSREVVSLPMYPEMTPAQQERVVEALHQFFCT